jgi:hypothetical protein
MACSFGSVEVTVATFERGLESGAGAPWAAAGATSISLDVDDELIQAPLNDVEKNVRDASGIDNFRKNAQ